MNNTLNSAKHYRLPINTDHIRSIKDPHDPQIHITHAYVKVKDFCHGELWDKINPRIHESYLDKPFDELLGPIPKAIKLSIEERPKRFHLFNRGLLIIAQKAWYDNNSKEINFIINSEDEGGLADGATTDRILANLKTSSSEVSENTKDLYIHLEIISGTLNDDGNDLIRLTDARNKSKTVPEFALLDLGNEYEVLQKTFNDSVYKDKIAYRGNEIDKPADIRTVLGILTLFHPKWDKENKEPVVAYSSKGSVLSHYKDKDWKEGYIALSKVAVDILDLHNYIHLKFQEQYQKAFGPKARVGARKEVKYNDGKIVSSHPLLLEPVIYGIPDGWVYPILASFRTLLKWTKNGSPEWKTDPKIIFDQYGSELIETIIEESESLGRNANATGKKKGIWKMLRIVLKDKPTVKN